MNCTYKLKVKKGEYLPFNNEIELNDFLLDTKDFDKFTLDVIFSSNANLSVRALEIYDILKRNTKSVEELLETGKVVFSTAETEVDERYQVSESGVLGVNKFLGSRKKEDGNPLFPIFRAKEYWKNKFLMWERGFDPEEDNIEEIRNVLGKQVDSITDPLDLLKLKEYYTKKWRELGRIGNSIHEVLRIFFSRDARGECIMDYAPNVRKEAIIKAFNRAKDSHYAHGKYAELTEEQIDNIIGYGNSLLIDLRSLFGNNALFLPEVVLGTAITPEDIFDEKTGKVDHYDAIQGIIDLLVIDEAGNPQIVDYKTSPKDYEDYDSAKKLTFYYQLGAYHRLVNNAGINLSAYSRTFIAPIKMDKFRLENDEWVFDKVVPYLKPTGSTLGYTLLEDLTPQIINGVESDRILHYLDKSIPKPTITKHKPKEVLLYVHDGMKKFFNAYLFEDDLDKEAMEYAKKHKYDKKNSKGEYTYTVYYPKKKVVHSTDFNVVLEAIKELLKHDSKRVLQWTDGIKGLLITAQQQHNPSQIFVGVGKNDSSEGSPNWINHLLSRYAKGGWVFKPEFESLEALGIITLYNEYNGLYNFIKIIDQNVNGEISLNGNKYLTGNFLSDVIEDSKSNTLILDNTHANRAMIEVMLALNSNPHLFGNAAGSIGEIMVINPRERRGKKASNKELLYNFDALCRLAKRNDNNFTFGSTIGKNKIRLSSTIDIVRNHLTEIFKIGEGSVWTLMPAELKKCRTTTEELKTADNPSRVRSILLKLNELLEGEFESLRRIHTESTDEPLVLLLQEIFMAISEIDGYDQRLLNRDDAQWIASFRELLSKGHSGTELDNQGFLSNPSLNRLAKATTIAYQNTRTAVLAVKADMRELIENVKKDEGFNYFIERTVGNLSDLYHDLIDWDREDDLYFVDPSTVASESKRKLLEFALYNINKNRLVPVDKRHDEAYVKAVLEERKAKNMDDYLRVPLKIASSSSRAANVGGMAGLFSALKEKLRAWNPATAALYLKETVENFTDNEGDLENRHNVNVSERILHNAIWHMVNSFARGESDDRLSYIAEMGREAFETNLETLVLEQEFAYALKENLDEIFPMIRATMMNVAMQGMIENFKFKDTLEYIGKYIRNKIFNQSLAGEEGKGIKIFISKLQTVASKLALGFSPALLYQHLDGLWKDISLFIRKPDGETSFTFLNMKDAWLYVYRDFVHFGNGNSLCELINELYGINDMDMNAYVSKIKSDQGGIFNLDLFMFRMASRPDFYNRLTIFGAQMRGDGCWDAHYVKDGRLVYDMNLDKRFDLFVSMTPREALKLTGDELTKYNEQKALYIAMAEQLKREHTRDDKGQLFDYNLAELDKTPKLFPKAYTTELSEGMKALGDMIYGYYSHEKKSMVAGSTIGGLVMQMNTYWSSKKNLFLAPGGTRYMGRMLQYTEQKKDKDGNVIIGADGLAEVVKYWHVIGEDGLVRKDNYGNPIIVSDDEVTEGMKVIPFMRWKGQFQEGIFVTLFNEFKTLVKSDAEGLGGKWEDMRSQYWNHPDPDIRRAYRSNIMQGWGDLIMWILIGCLFGPHLEKAAKGLMRENENDTLSEAFTNTLYNLGANLVISSGNDFNAPKSILGIGMSWTPFSVQTFGRVISNFGNVLGGDKSFYDALVSSAAATRSTRPMWDYIGDETGWNIARNDEEE